MSHIRNLHIRNGTAGGNLLELTLKWEFAECINLLSDIHMIRVCIISFIRNIFDFAELLKINSCKTITKRFCRCTIETETDIRFVTPSVCSFFHMIHDTKCKLLAHRVCMTNTLHQLRHFIKADISKRHRWITAIQKRINLLSLVQTGNCAILPMNRTNIRQCSF